MDKENKEQKFYSIAEDFNIFRSYGEKIEIIRRMKLAYGPHLTLEELEALLWEERQLVVNRIKMGL